MDIKDSFLKAIDFLKDGRLYEAESLCKNILELDDGDFYTLQCFGIIQYFHKNYDVAIDYLLRALKIRPDDSTLYYNLGIVYKEKGEIDKAIESYRRAIEGNPDFADAYNNLGILLKEKGVLDDAMEYFGKAIKLNPSLYEAYINLGNTLKDKGLINDSLEVFRKAINLRPECWEAYYGLGTVLHYSGRIDDAIEKYNIALGINQNLCEVYYSLGMAYFETGRQELALDSFKKALDYSPWDFKSRWAYCIAQIPIIYLSEEEILVCRERYEEELRRINDTLSSYIRKDIDESVKAIGAIQPFYLAYQCMNDVKLQKMYGDIICNIMSKKYPKFVEVIEMPHLSDDDCIKVGIVSGYFYNHSNWKVPIRGWIENVNKDRFRLYGYYTNNIKDDATNIAKGIFYKFVEDVYSFDELCRIIKDDGLHVLIYPEIGMDPLTLKLASLRLAPIQCVSWGHPETSGLETIDYFLSSELMEPDDGERNYTEKLIRLRNLSVYFYPLDNIKIDLRKESMGFKSDEILYLCSQSLFKYLPQYDCVFVRIAQEVKNCKFLFISSSKGSFLTNRFRKRLSTAFEKDGLIADDYVVFLPFLDELNFKKFNKISDVFLDSIGWSGCNTTLEAIECNLPVVTMPGEFMRGRHSYAILKFMGVDDTIAESLEDYIKIAVELGKDREFRDNISKKIELNKDKIYFDIGCVKSLEDFLLKVVKDKRVT